METMQTVSLLDLIYNLTSVLFCFVFQKYVLTKSATAACFRKLRSAAVTLSGIT